MSEGGETGRCLSHSDWLDEDSWEVHGTRKKVGSPDPGFLVATEERRKTRRERKWRVPHDRLFGEWKLLVGPNDWIDHSAGKPGSTRYCLHNLPPPGIPGTYELGLLGSRGRFRKITSAAVAVVYVGHTEDLRTRMQQYGHGGSHLQSVKEPEACGAEGGKKTGGWSLRFDRNVSRQCSKDQLFEDAFNRGLSITFRWTPAPSKQAAAALESQLLASYDYCWNRMGNSQRRPTDAITTCRHPGLSRRVACLMPATAGALAALGEVAGWGRDKNGEEREASSADQHSKEKPLKLQANAKTQLRTELPKVVRHPVQENQAEAGTALCGVEQGNGRACREVPRKGRKRCDAHKGMRVAALTAVVTTACAEGKVAAGAGPTFTAHATEVVICGVLLDGGIACTKIPVKGRKRCAEHKGRRVQTDRV